jgi:hypothetical protein
VQCPSGFTIEIRGLLTNEANILADMQAQQQGSVTDSILTSTWVSTVDNGPYKFPGAPVWEQVLSGDRFYAHMMARIATHGDEYGFDLNCSHCRAKIRWDVALGDIPVRKLSDEDKAAFVAGNKLTTTGPDGKTYTFHLNTGKHEKRAQMLLKQSPQSKLTAALTSRIDAIEGVMVVSEYVGTLPFGDACALIDTLDEHDCGVETDISVSCSQCGATSDVALPFGQAGFWAPRRKKRSF